MSFTTVFKCGFQSWPHIVIHGHVSLVYFYLEQFPSYIFSFMTLTFLGPSRCFIKCTTIWFLCFLMIRFRLTFVAKLLIPSLPHNFLPNGFTSTDDPCLNQLWHWLLIKELIIYHSYVYLLIFYCKKSFPFSTPPPQLFSITFLVLRKLMNNAPTSKRGVTSTLAEITT